MFKKKNLVIFLITFFLVAETSLYSYSSNPEDFVKELAWEELKRLNLNIEEFLRNNSATDDTEKLENTKKMLLQEEKDNG